MYVFQLVFSSCHKNFASAVGNGLVLIDFGRAVDLTVFPADTQFQGSSETEGFQCTQMLEGKLWKHEVQWNLSHPDTNGQEGSVLYSEVSFQGLKLVYFGPEKVSYLEK